VTLGAEGGGEGMVEHGGRHRIVAAALAAQQLAEHADGGDHREQQRVEMGDVPHPVARTLDHPGQRGGGVAALVMMGEVVRAPHPGRRRHGQQQAPAGR